MSKNRKRYTDDETSCIVTVTVEEDGFVNPKNGEKHCCSFGSGDTPCINEADVQFWITSGYVRIRYLCQGCLPLAIKLCELTRELKE